MSGGPEDLRLDTRKLLTRLCITERHLRRLVKLGRFPSPHYLGERRRWWLSEVMAWEGANTSTEAPADLTRGVGNLRQGPEAEVAQ